MPVLILQILYNSLSLPIEFKIANILQHQFIQTTIFGYKHYILHISIDSCEIHLFKNNFKQTWSTEKIASPKIFTNLSNEGDASNIRIVKEEAFLYFSLLLIICYSNTRAQPLLTSVSCKNPGKVFATTTPKLFYLVFLSSSHEDADGKFRSEVCPETHFFLLARSFERLLRWI